MNDNNMSSYIEDFEWEFNLVDEDVPNAWCMPGGKVVFYTGILPYTKTEQGLAVVMGHEIAHAIARHGNERMSQQLMLQAGGTLLSLYLAEKEEENRDLYLAAYGVGSTLGVYLP
ncbi:MAG: M48 family metallopeptidase [Bacteroidales bacterium]|nr:M48 family metallopeptidase [Bacteroidales bacterium]